MSSRKLPSSYDSSRNDALRLAGWAHPGARTSRFRVNDRRLQTSPSKIGIEVSKSRATRGSTRNRTVNGSGVRKIGVASIYDEDVTFSKPHHLDRRTR